MIKSLQVKEKENQKHLQTIYLKKNTETFLYIFVFSLACIIYELLVTVYMPSIFYLHIKAFLSLKNKLFDYLNLIACQCKLLH